MRATVAASASGLGRANIDPLKFLPNRGLCNILLLYVGSLNSNYRSYRTAYVAY